jgi:putative ABC transport system permease protein
MFSMALTMLTGDRAKYAGLLFGITFTSFLVTFAISFLSGFLTWGFALISENQADVWVMDPTVESDELTTNLPASALARVRSVEGVQSAVPLALGTGEARFPNGRFQPFQVIGVDDATLGGVPPMRDGDTAVVLRAPDAVVVDPGGTRGKLQTPIFKTDQWSYGKAGLDAPTRPLARGDELLVNEHRVWVAGRSQGLSRFPPRPLMYTTFSNADRILLPERRRLTFVLVTAAPDVAPRTLAARIQAQTGLRARTSEDFKADTVRWYLANSEDVEDVGWMLTLAAVIGLGVTGVMLYMFTNENLWQYAVLSAMGATPRMLLSMILAQAGLCALLGTSMGIGLCAIVGQLAAVAAHYPFRMMWFGPLLAGVTIAVVSLVAAALSARPVFKLQPMVVFERR